MINTTMCVYELLTRGGSELSASVGTRVWSPNAPDSWNNTTNAIIFHEDSGSSHYTGATLTSTFVFKCYGGSNSHTDAFDLFKLLYERLQSRTETVAKGTIIGARLLTSFNMPPEPDTQFKSHTARFSISFEG